MSGPKWARSLAGPKRVRVWVRWHLSWLGPGPGPDKGPKKSES